MDPAAAFRQMHISSYKIFQSEPNDPLQFGNKTKPQQFNLEYLLKGENRQCFSSDIKNEQTRKTKAKVRRPSRAVFIRT